MKKSKEMLRQRFEAQTDIELAQKPDWKSYAKWLEALDVKDLNKEMLKENVMLRNRIQEAMDALEKGITGARAKRR